MHKYSPTAIAYISLNIISLSLLTFIIIKLCMLPNYFTKYTQFQLFVASWGYMIGCLPTIIKYGDDVINKAFETQTSSICVIQQMISLFFFYPLHIFPVILGFYMWNAIENQNIKIEKKYFWTFSILIWCFTICYNVFSLADGYQKNILVTPLLCFTAIILWKRWRQFSNRWNVLRLGHALRLFICGVVYTSMLGISLLSRIISQYVKNSENTEMNKIVIEDFVQPFIGIMLFLIFVKKDSPAVFLPCFYYGSPEKLMIKSECRNDSSSYERSASLISSFNEINQISITVQQVTTITSHTTLADNEIQMKLKELK
ncbi:hypothetical protein GLOIN_2v1705497 [Rhizophagus clarus]|uniref:Uncharacterized protein n=1 Tax=Rhizophagus clarus TaxID=94130 RepID=A0A8H3QX50_9GLOM|nr:hypothetical protein GLOIN_2v1705497 [Rhizophagus clarus]